MTEPKYKVIFSSIVKPVVSDERDELLALASIEKLKSFVPEVNLEQNNDLLPFACNVCVVNRVNKNGHVIDTETALGMYQTFIHKFVDIEHDRQKIVGCILTAGFSEFGTDKPLTLEQAKELKEPFNIVVGGIVWKLANKNLSYVLEDSADPTSENYMGVSASWELGFSEFNLILLKGKEKNIKAARIISEPQDVEKLAKMLKINGGEGMIDGEFIYMEPHTDVKALGMALTETPAADVKGMLFGSNNEIDAHEEHFRKECSCGSVISQCRCASEHKKVEVIEKGCSECSAKASIETDKSEESKKIISQPTTLDVKRNSNIMKITRVEDITDASLKEISASAITEFINTELKKASDAHTAEKEAKEKAAQEAKAAAEKAQKDLDDTKGELKKIQDSLVSIQAAEETRAKTELFNQRMSAWDAEYDLDSEDRQAIASQIKDMADEVYAAFQKNTAILMKSKKKGAKDTKKEAKASVEVTASEDKTKNEDAAKIAEAALEKSKVEVPKVPVAASASQSTLKEKYAKAFAPDQFTVSVR